MTKKQMKDFKKSLKKNPPSPSPILSPQQEKLLADLLEFLGEVRTELLKLKCRAGARGLAEGLKET